MEKPFRKDGQDSILEVCCHYTLRYSLSEDKWSDAAPMPTYLNYFGVAVLAGELYVVGGWDKVGEPVKAVNKFSPITDVWSPVASLSKERSMLGAASLNGHLYAIGGMDYRECAVNTTERFDMESDTWNVRAPLCTPRFGWAGQTSFRIVVNATCFFAIAGLFRDDNSSRNGSIGVGSIEQFDVDSNTWTCLTSMPMADYRINYCVDWISGFLCFCGLDESQIFMYELDSASWSTVSIPNPLGFKLDFSGVGFVGGHVYIFGGRYYDNSGHGQKVTGLAQRYDPQTREWDQREWAPTEHAHCAVVNLRQRLIAIGCWGTGPVASYDAELDEWKVLAPLPKGSGARISGLTAWVYSSC